MARKKTPKPPVEPPDLRGAFGNAALSDEIDRIEHLMYGPLLDHISAGGEYKNYKNTVPVDQIRRLTFLKFLRGDEVEKLRYSGGNISFKVSMYLSSSIEKDDLKPFEGETYEDLIKYGLSSLQSFSNSDGLFDVRRITEDARDLLFVMMNDELYTEPMTMLDVFASIHDGFVAARQYGFEQRVHFDRDATDFNELLKKFPITLRPISPAP